MPTPKLASHTRELIEQYLRQGIPHTEIVNIMRREHGTRISMGTISNIRTIPSLTPPVRANKKVGEFNWRDWVPKMRELQDLNKKSSFSQDTACIELGNGKSPVALAAYSDHHIGSYGTDYDALVKSTDEVLAVDNVYLALVGDYGQYSIKLRSVLEVSDNMIPPAQQTDFIESWFEEIWPKVAFATWDNHAVERGEKLAGESSVKKLLSKKVVYFNGIGHVNLKVGDQIYRGAVSHKFAGRSILNPVHSMMRYMRFQGTDREWAMAGDTHTPGMLKYTDGDRTRVVVNSGSLQTDSGYAKRYFSLTTHPVYPIIVFHPDKHQMTPFWSIAEYLHAKK